MSEYLTYIDKLETAGPNRIALHGLGDVAMNGLISLAEPITTENNVCKNLEIVTTDQAANELIGIYSDRPEYSFESANQEKPYIHQTRCGNIFQILRFGIQSNNFKNRLDELREDNTALEEIAKQMNGIRFVGASYQEDDSVSLSEYSEKKAVPHPNKLVFLINPDIGVVGRSDNERDITSGYGSGIKSRVIDGEYKIGNKMAYSDEVLGVNVILPKDIRAVIVGKYSSIISDMSNITMESEKYLKKPRAAEDIVANSMLLAGLTGSDDLVFKINELKNNMESMDYSKVCSELFYIQKSALSRFVGIGNEVNEENVRKAIEEKFNIQFIEKN